MVRRRNPKAGFAGWQWEGVRVQQIRNGKLLLFIILAAFVVLMHAE